MDPVPIESVNCSLTFFLCGELTETKSFKQSDTIHERKITSGTISLSIDYNAESFDLATTGEEIEKLALTSSPWDVANEYRWSTGSPAATPITSGFQFTNTFQLIQIDIILGGF